MCTLNAQRYIRGQLKRRFYKQGIAGQKKLEIYQSRTDAIHPQNKRKTTIEIHHGEFSAELPKSPGMYWVRILKSEDIYPIRVFSEVWHDEKNTNGLQYFIMGWEEFCPLSDFQGEKAEFAKITPPEQYTYDKRGEFTKI